MKKITLLLITTAMVILNYAQTGNVGIGTANPAELFHIGQRGGLKLTNSETSDVEGTPTGVVIFDENYYEVGEAGNGNFTGNGGGLAVYNEDGWGALISTANMRFADLDLNSLNVGYANTIDPGNNNALIEGRLGLGTTNPRAKLDLQASGVDVNENGHMRMGNLVTSWFDYKFDMNNLPSDGDANEWQSVASLVRGAIIDVHIAIQDRSNVTGATNSGGQNPPGSAYDQFAFTMYSMRNSHSNASSANNSLMVAGCQSARDGYSPNEGIGSGADDGYNVGMFMFQNNEYGIAYVQDPTSTFSTSTSLGSKTRVNQAHDVAFFPFSLNGWNNNNFLRQPTAYDQDDTDLFGNVQTATDFSSNGNNAAYIRFRINQTTATLQFQFNFPEGTTDVSRHDLYIGFKIEKFDAGPGNGIN